ncbi:MAG: hypothetical protein RSB42_04025, partial [Comamonas sp.]
MRMTCTPHAWPSGAIISWHRLGLGLARCAWLAAGAAQAARPMITAEARNVDAKSCQVESWVKSNRG